MRVHTRTRTRTDTHKEENLLERLLLGSLGASISAHHLDLRAVRGGGFRGGGSKHRVKL